MSLCEQKGHDIKQGMVNNLRDKSVWCHKENCPMRHEKLMRYKDEIAIYEWLHKRNKMWNV
jgi:hypothetical protein